MHVLKAQCGEWKHYKATNFSDEYLLEPPVNNDTTSISPAKRRQQIAANTLSLCRLKKQQPDSLAEFLVLAQAGCDLLAVRYALK